MEQTISKVKYGLIITALIEPLVLVVALLREIASKSFDLLLSVGYLGFTLFLSCWLTTPYILMWYSLKNYTGTTYKLTLDYIAMLSTSIIGLYRFADIIYFHPDAQGGIALFLIPLLQVAIFGILSMLFNIADIIKWFLGKD